MVVSDTEVQNVGVSGHPRHHAQWLRLSMCVTRGDGAAPVEAATTKQPPRFPRRARSRRGHLLSDGASSPSRTPLSPHLSRGAASSLSPSPCRRVLTRRRCETVEVNNCSKRVAETVSSEVVISHSTGRSSRAHTIQQVNNSVTSPVVQTTAHNRGSQRRDGMRLSVSLIIVQTADVKRTA